MSGNLWGKQALLRVVFSTRSSITCALVAILLVTSGCASTGQNKPAITAKEPPAVEGSSAIEPTVVAFRDYRDPLIGVNRAMFGFNDVSYRYVLIPLSKGYLKVVPEPVRQCIGNFFYNLKSPLYFINNLLQLNLGDAGRNAARFGINTTIGLLGLFDPAENWFDIEKANTNLNDTLALYGAGYGIYLVLPILGSSDLRSGTSQLVEGFFHPVTHIAEGSDRVIIQSIDYFQAFAPQAEAYITLTAESDDPYIYLRNQYLQAVQRDAAYQGETGEDESN